MPSSNGNPSMVIPKHQREGHAPADPQSKASPGPVCMVGRGGLIQFVNGAFTRKFGKRPTDWTGNVFRDLVHPEDRRLISRSPKTNGHGARSSGFEVRCITPQGWRWMLWESDPAVSDNSSDVLVGQDVTRRHIAEEQSFILAQAVEQCPIGVAITEPEGGIRYVNARFAAAAGKTLEHLLDHESTPGAFDPLSGTDKEAIARHLAMGQVWQGEISSQDSEGAQRWESVRVAGIRNATGVTTHHLILRDEVTDRKILEAQLLQSQKVESLGTLAGGIAHDFNNLLAIITGYAEMVIQSTEGDERMQRFAKEIHKAGERATGLVRQILTFSRKADVVRTPLVLNELVEEICGMLSETFPRIISFEFSLSRDCAQLMADHNQMQQVILNLCVNARDAMPGGGRLGVETIRAHGSQLARLGANPARNYICLRISDNGVGMPPEVARRVFEPFFTTKNLGSGTGLGLAVVDGIVSRHEGFIEVESEVGVGSTFSVYIPESSNQEAHQDEAVQKPSAPAGSGKILLVEDEEALRVLLSDSFKDNGYTVITAENGVTAIDALTEHGASIDAIVLDVNMPRRNGVAVLKEARHRFPGIRILLMSGNLTDENRSDLEATPPDAFMAKPFRIDEAIRTIHEMLASNAEVRVSA